MIVIELYRLRPLQIILLPQLDVTCEPISALYVTTKGYTF
jgi:hypothetical protein